MFGEFLPNRLDQVVYVNPAFPAGQLALDSQLLSAPDDVFNHGSGGEVPEVEDLLVTVLVGHLEKAVALFFRVHLGHCHVDHGQGGLVPVTPACRLHRFLVDRQVAH